MNHSPIQGIAKDSRMPSSLISLRNAVARRSPVQTPTAVFPFLSAIFFYLLWALMFQNGSADMMNEAVATGTLADGQPLRTRFSSIAPIDSLLATLVAFTYPVTSGRDKSSWLLMVDIVSTLQTGMLWAHMENNRVGRKTSWLA